MRIHPFNEINDESVIDISNEINDESVIEINEQTLDDTLLCAICLENIDSPDKLISCVHLYHPKCIIRWYKKQTIDGMTPSCPTCKKQYDSYLFAIKILNKKIEKFQNMIDSLYFILNHNKSLTWNDRKFIKSTIIIYNNTITNIKIDKNLNPHKSRFLDYNIISLPCIIEKLLSITKNQVENDKIIKIKENDNLFENKYKWCFNCFHIK